MIEQEKIDHIKATVDMVALAEAKGIRMKKNSRGYFGLVGAEKMRLKLLSDNTVVLELAPGGHTPDHTHGDKERLIVMAGTGTVKADHAQTPIQPSDFIEFAPDEPHQIINTGKDTLVLMCLRNQG